MKAKQLFNKYTILSFIIVYHKHAKNPKDSYLANILFEKHHSQPALNLYNINLNSMPALHSF